MTTRRAIDAKDLDAATRTKLGIGTARDERDASRLSRDKSRGRDEHAIAGKRVHTGKAFEADLAITHQQYEYLKWGKLWPHAPPFLRVKGQWCPRAGGGPCDYTGHINVARHPDGTLYPVRHDHLAARTVPVAFDAKVGDAKSAVYHHEQKRQHQLHALREASAAGVAAFLLVLMPQLDRPHGRLFVIDVPSHFAELLTEGVRLFEPPHRGVGATPRGDPCLLLPSVGIGASTSTSVTGWDWIPLLDWVRHGGG